MYLVSHYCYIQVTITMLQSTPSNFHAKINHCKVNQRYRLLRGIIAQFSCRADNSLCKRIYKRAFSNNGTDLYLLPDKSYMLIVSDVVSYDFIFFFGEIDSLILEIWCFRVSVIIL